MRISDEYAKLKERLNKIEEQLKFLNDDPVVQEYLTLVEIRQGLKNELEQLGKNKQEEEYEICEHLWVKTPEMKDSCGRTILGNYCCVKCGLNRGILQNEAGYHGVLPKNEQTMYDYLLKEVVYGGIEIQVSGNYDLIKAVFQRIKQNHPGIDDATASHYLVVALNDINKIKVSPDREQMRVNRLALSEESYQENRQKTR